MRALIIDDEPGIRMALTHFLKSRGYETFDAESGASGMALARQSLPDLVFLDYRLPDVDGEALLAELVAPEIGACVLMMTGYAELDQAVRAIKSGAEYFFSKPIDLERLALILDSVENRLELLREGNRYRYLNEQASDSSGLIGSCPQMLAVKKLISLLARNPSTPVLVLGESGTGKELVTRSIHKQSGVIGQLVELNSASLSESLLEAELFGYEKGAFTDAGKTKPGLFEVAANGTIFFDELTEMSLAIQAKLLKVLDTKFFRRIGGVLDLVSSARFIGATNRNIAGLVASGLFREDLFYRINVIPISLPPLRERGNDVIMLAEHFIRQLGIEMGKRPSACAAGFMEAIKEHSWPGNIRELRNVIERALLLADGQELTEKHLPYELISGRAVAIPDNRPACGRRLRDVEDEHILNTIKFTDGNLTNAARILGISRSTLHLRLKEIQG